MSARLALGLALTLAAGCAAAPVNGRRDVIRQILTSTVQLRAERPGGVRRAASGVVVASDPRTNRTWVVTARHFVDPPLRQQVSVAVPGTKDRKPVSVTARSPDLDLAVLELEGLALPPVRFKEAVRLGDEVWVVAFPWGRRLTVVSGVVSQLAVDDGDVATEGMPRMVDASVSYGSSGGGIYDAESGALVGIVESYRTARVAIPEAPNRTLELPVPGETTVVPSQALVRFLVGAGLAQFLPR